MPYQGSQRPNNIRWCCSILQDIANTRNQGNESSAMNKAFFAPFSPLILEIIDFMFHLSWLPLENQHLQVKGCQKYKNILDYMVEPWKHKVVLEIIRWCWKVKRWFYTTLKLSMENPDHITVRFVLFPIRFHARLGSCTRYSHVQDNHLRWINVHNVGKREQTTDS